MASSSTVKVEFLGDASSLARASKQAAGDLDKVGKKTGINPKVAAGAAVAGAALIAFGKSSVTAFVEAEQSSARLDDALAKFPATNDRTRASFDSLNSALAKKTKFDDDATASGQAVLAQFKLTGSQIQQLTPLLQDYAAKTGKDIPAAADVLGKALQGKGKALAEVGIKFKDAGSTGANFEQIVGGLRTQVGGFAEKEGKTAAGQAAILSNQFGEVQETVGAKLTPALTALAGMLLQVVDFVQRNSRVITPLVAVLGGLALVVWAVNAAGRAYAATQAAVNMVMAMNPIGLVVVAIAALVAGIVLAYRHSETFRNIVQGAFSAISAAASFMWNGVLKPTFKFLVDAFLAVAGTIVHGAASAFGWVPGIGGKLKATANAFDTFRDQVNASLDGVRKSVHVQVSADFTAYGKDALGVATNAAAHGRATGGPVSAGTPYIVGEKEPELFVPDRSGHIYNQRQMASLGSGGGSGGIGGGTSGGGVTVIVKVEGSLIAQHNLVDELHRVLVQKTFRTGALGLA